MVAKSECYIKIAGDMHVLYSVSKAAKHVNVWATVVKKTPYGFEWDVFGAPRKYFFRDAIVFTEKRRDALFNLYRPAAEAWAAELTPQYSRGIGSAPHPMETEPGITRSGKVEWTQPEEVK